VVAESVARVGAHLRDVRNQFAAGLLPPNDVSSAEAQESRQRMLSVQAHAITAVAAAELARLVDVPFDTAIQPVSALTPPALASGDLAALVDEGRAHRSDRAALVTRVAAANERRKAAGAGHKPIVAVAGGVDYARPNPRIFPREAAWRESWDAGVNVSWPIFDGGRTRADMAEAAANSRAAEERLGDVDSAIALEVKQRWIELDASRSAIAAAEDAVRSADEARRVVGDRFAAGVATSTDVLDVQVVLLQAALDRTQAIAGARLAEARLARALGR
jgi:outer membrane protein TolC